jgi:zinc/manganese transport system substrate-binding protein
MVTSILSSFAAASTLAAAPLRVVTTTQDLASIAQSVGGNRANVTALISGARDPHRLEAKPSFMAAVARADLFIAVGLDMEVGYEKSILQGSRNRKVQIGAAGHVYGHEGALRILDKPSGPVSRGQGDIHAGGNPHYWLDPYNARAMARAFASKMGELRPQDAAFFKENASNFVENVDRQMFGSALVAKFGGEKLWAWDNQDQLRQNIQGTALGGWAAKLAPYRGRPIITYHRSWSYFVDRFGLKVAGELEPKPGLDPTPGHMRNIVQIAQQQNVKVILQEPFYSTRDAKFVSSRTSAKVVVSPNSVGHDPAARDYFSLIDTIVNRVSGAMGG